jgi:hypothetical protein
MVKIWALNFVILAVISALNEVVPGGNTVFVLQPWSITICLQSWAKLDPGRILLVSFFVGLHGGILLWQLY